MTLRCLMVRAWRYVITAVYTWPTARAVRLPVRPMRSKPVATKSNSGDIASAEIHRSIGSHCYRRARHAQIIQNILPPQPVAHQMQYVTITINACVTMGLRIIRSLCLIIVRVPNVRTVQPITQITQHLGRVATVLTLRRHIIARRIIVVWQVRVRALFQLVVVVPRMNKQTSMTDKIVHLLVLEIL